jgi:predicted ribosome quality control (RQC) complex YloA/Tae2 family protein
MIQEANSPKNPLETLDSETGHLISVTKRALKRVRTKMLKQEEELKQAQQYPHLTQVADSLLAHPDQVGRGASTALLENIHTQEKENVALNPAQSVFVNAETYYKKARKGRRGLSIIERRLEEAHGDESELLRIAQDLQTLRSGDTPAPPDLQDRLAALRGSLQTMGVLPRRETAKTPGGEAAVPYRHLELDGWDIYIGKNDGQNDELSTRFARPWDIWMHAAACAGSHVVVRRDKSAPWPPKDLLLKAASFAVWFSKAKHTSYADVNVTEARFVRKRRHAPPGEVIAERCKTLRVSPRSPQEFFGGDFDK